MMMMVAWECEGTNAVELVIEMVRMVHFNNNGQNLPYAYFAKKTKRNLSMEEQAKQMFLWWLPP